jgi:hypothetical protein
MTTKTNDDGGPAFPIQPMPPHDEAARENWIMAPGMSLRDYFAAAAMGGLCTDHPDAADSTEWDFERMARTAYVAADAMLAARAANAEAGR